MFRKKLYEQHRDGLDISWVPYNDPGSTEASNVRETEDTDLQLVG